MVVILTKLSLDFKFLMSMFRVGISLSIILLLGMTMASCQIEADKSPLHQQKVEVESENCLSSTSQTIPDSCQGEEIHDSSATEEQYQESLPSDLSNLVLGELSSQTKIPVKNLTIVAAKRETWSNGCLGLPKLNEFCTQMLVEGWRITIGDGEQTWVYRTDLSGENIKLEQ